MTILLALLLSTGYLPVPDSQTRLPVTVIRGAKPGPTLGIIAGIHGVEYVPIVALNDFARQIDPAALRGTIILVHMSNPAAFYRRSIYYNPEDWKNLNRVFPGKPDGTISERIAHVITTEIIDKVDAFIDVHCGDGNEDLTPYVSFFADAPDAEVAKRSREMAMVFGIPIIKPNRDPSRNPQLTMYTTNTAAVRGKPHIGIELGGLGRVEESQVATVKRGLLNVIRHLGMLDGSAPQVDRPMFMVRSVSVKSPATGVWFPETSAGRMIAEKARIGSIRDPFGNVIAEVVSPMTGYVVYLTVTPPTNEGETLASIGVYSDREN